MDPAQEEAEICMTDFHASIFSFLFMLYVGCCSSEHIFNKVRGNPNLCATLSPFSFIFILTFLTKLKPVIGQWS